MQMIMGNLILAIWVYPLITFLIVIRKLAINAYRENNYTASSWLTSLGKKLANSKSLKFSIALTVLLIAVTLITLSFSLSFWFTPSYGYSELLPSAYIPAPPIILFLLMGLLYVTMTHRGLAWWDANVIIFRFAGFHGRRSYLKNEIKDLIEENQEGVDDPYRAYLTLERLFNHEFDVGNTTRDILEQMAPEYHKEFEKNLLESSTTMRFSYVLLLIAFITGFLSIFFFAFGSLITLPTYNTSLVVDTLLGIALSFHLMWMIFSTLEIPIMRPNVYQSLISQSMNANGVQNSL